MSASSLILSMERLLKLHNSLYEIAVKKTDILKKGDMEALNQLMKDEQKHIAAIGKIEEERKQITKVIIPESENPTIADCLNLLEGTEYERLSNLRDALQKSIISIQSQNELNQQMLHQSLQFINLSMSLFTPPEPEDFLYLNPGRKSNDSTYSSGMFNSKA